MHIYSVGDVLYDYVYSFVCVLYFGLVFHIVYIFSVMCVCSFVLYFHFSCVSAYLYYSCYVHLFCRSEQSVSSLNICTADPPDWTSDGAHQLFYLFRILLFYIFHQKCLPGNIVGLNHKDFTGSL